MVPRTFLGPLTISSLAFPVVTALKVAHVSKLWSQFTGSAFYICFLSLISKVPFKGFKSRMTEVLVYQINSHYINSIFFFSISVRFCLGLLSLLAFSKFRNSISVRFGQDVGKFLAVITATQFHFLFYISRPLPNIFALILGKYKCMMFVFLLLLKCRMCCTELTIN